jgi:hypothetical protein
MEMQHIVDEPYETNGGGHVITNPGHIDNDSDVAPAAPKPKPASNPFKAKASSNPFQN